MDIWQHVVSGGYVEVIVKYRERWLFCMEVILDTTYAIQTILIIAKPKDDGISRFSYERQAYADQLMWFDNGYGELVL